VEADHDSTSEAGRAARACSTTSRVAAAVSVSASGAIAHAATRSVTAPIVTWTAPQLQCSTSAKSPVARVRRRHAAIHAVIENDFQSHVKTY
jgi:hypothetical protein